MVQQGKIEFIVGVFTIIGLALLSVLVFSVSDFYFYKKGYEINVLFNYVSILDKGAPVRMSGLRVGEVKRVNIEYEEKTQKPIITAVLFVNSAAIVRENSVITIRGTTPLSEPHVEIISAGLSDGRQLESGATIRGVDPIPMEKLLITANEILDAVNKFTARLNVFFDDPSIAQSVKGILVNLNALTASLKEVTAGKEGHMADTITKIEKTADNLEYILQNIRDGKGTAGKIFVDEELYNELLAFVKDLKAHPWKLLAKPKNADKKSFLIF